jgi:hypothetical protein
MNRELEFAELIGRLESAITCALMNEGLPGMVRISLEAALEHSNKRFDEINWGSNGKNYESK